MRKLRLLLIEGEPEVRELMATVLRSRFGDTSVESDSSLACASQRDLACFDLVLTDWMLPDAFGPTVMDSLRKRGAHAIIVVTDANVAAVATEAVLCGAVDYVVRHRDFLSMLPLVIEKNLAIDQLRRERDALHRQVQSQHDELSKLLKSLQEAAATDPLTGLYNRRHFARLLEQMFADAQRGGTDLSCIMIDMDNFKRLNDTHGHQAGDAALVSASSMIRDNLRRMDAAARYGGDEFVLLLPRTDSLEATNVARRIRSAYNSDLTSRGFVGLSLGMSFGVASISGDHPESSDALIASADQALYRAKRLGRERIIVSTLTAETHHQREAV